MIRKDTIFDGIAEKFKRNIYGSNKGYIRLNVLWSDMLHAIPKLSGKPLSILDAGGGIGQISLKCAELGHTIDLCEASQDMLDLAHAEIEQSDTKQSITTIHSTVQNLHTHTDQQYDVVVFHAVLEWLAEPKETLKELLTFLKPGGTLSLMFYNRNSAIMKTILKGNFYRKGGGFKFGQTTNLTPGNPLDQNNVYAWLHEWDFKVTNKCGIRVFNDYLHKEISQADLDKLLEVEKDFCRTEPFASMGRYIHVVCEKPA